MVKQKAMPLAAPVPVRKLADPDLVDEIFDLVVSWIPELSAKRFEIMAAVRAKFAGERAYIKRTNITEQLAVEFLSNFNGRNATEVARRLGIGRSSVYRLLKQPGHQK